MVRIPGTLSPGIRPFLTRRERDYFTMNGTLCTTGSEPALNASV